MQHLYLYISTFLCHWLSLAPAGILGIDGIIERYVPEAREYLNKYLGRWLLYSRLPALIFAIFSAGYLTWSDEHTRFAALDLYNSDLEQRLVTATSVERLQQNFLPAPHAIQNNPSPQSTTTIAPFVTPWLETPSEQVYKYRGNLPSERISTSLLEALVNGKTSIQAEDVIAPYVDTIIKFSGLLTYVSDLAYLSGVKNADVNVGIQSSSGLFLQCSYRRDFRNYLQHIQPNGAISGTGVLTQQVHVVGHLPVQIWLLDCQQ